MDAAWVAALDSLEAEITAAEQLVATRGNGEIVPWTAPALTSPLPAELESRARELSDRQQAVIPAVAAASAQAWRQLAVTDRIGRATRRTTTRSVYIDTSA